MTVDEKWLHLPANVVGFTGTDKNGHPDGLISVKSKLYFVFSQRKIKPLRVPVEVIHDTGVPLVHINLNFLTDFFGSTSIRTAPSLEYRFGP